MAEYSEKFIRLKTFILMAVGAPYGHPRSRQLMVLDRDIRSTNLFNNVEAHGFDIGSIRSSFETHAEARDKLKEFQAGKLEINEHRKIDPQSIRIHEMVYEARAIDFTDDEHEIMSVIGALDTMSAQDVAVIQATYPGLVDTSIKSPPHVSFDTRNGGEPNMQFSAFIRTSSEARRIFNEMAKHTDGQGFLLPVHIQPGKSFAESVNDNFYGCSFYKSLTGLAEEIGKEKIGISNTGLTEAMELKFYDYNETHKRRLNSMPIGAKANALNILSKADHAVAETLLRAMEARRINPFPG